MSNVLNLEENNQEQSGEPAAQEQPSVQEQVKNYLQELVGEGKKFKDTEALARSKAEGDAFIDHLKEENGGMRDTIKSLEEELRQFKTKKELDELRNSAAQRKQDEGPKDENQSQSVKPEDLESLIEQHLTRRESEQSAKANVDQTNAAIIKAFGDPDKAKLAINDKAQALGMSVKDITALAAKSPSAALSLLGVNNPSAPVKQDVTKSSTVASGVDLDGGQDIKAELDKLRRENWHKYWSPEVQNRIFQLKKEGKL